MVGCAGTLKVRGARRDCWGMARGVGSFTRLPLTTKDEKGRGDEGCKYSTTSFLLEVWIAARREASDRRNGE